MTQYGLLWTVQVSPTFGLQLEVVTCFPVDLLAGDSLSLPGGEGMSSSGVWGKRVCILSALRCVEVGGKPRAWPRIIPRPLTQGTGSQAGWSSCLTCNRLLASTPLPPTETHRGGDLNSRLCCLAVPEARRPRFSYQPGWWLLRPLPLAYRRSPSPCVFTGSSLCVLISPPVFFVLFCFVYFGLFFVF